MDSQEAKRRSSDDGSERDGSRNQFDDYDREREVSTDTGNKILLSDLSKEIIG